MKHAYNLLFEDYQNLKIAQNHKCAICKKRKKLSVDHDHKTRKVRALLCHKCNLTIGFIEKTEKLDEILKYLKEHHYDK